MQYDASSPRAYQALRDQGRMAVETGRLEEALRHFDQACRWAQDNGDQELLDRAFCNRSAVEIELGSGEGALSVLRQILLRNEDRENCFLSSYNLARYYELTKGYKKALFYARIAHDQARSLAQSEWIASSHNLIGDLLLAESYPLEATREYEQALALLPPEPTLRRGQILDNLGYCRMLAGRLDEGFELLYRSLRILRRLGARRALLSLHLDLAFGHLERGKLRLARRHAERALELAETLGHRDSIKNGYYLLGETANLAGDAVGARRCFERLERFYPETPFVTDFLMAVDIRKMINLKA